MVLPYVQYSDKRLIMKEITNAKDFLGKEVEVIMDRKLGTLHPKHGFTYMLNYGYIPNTISGDGEELDAYVLGIDKLSEDILELSKKSFLKTFILF